MKRICVILIWTFICLAYRAEAKSKESSLNPEKTTKATPAIIAIQIVDPNENSTSAKQKKRTIDEALGYGYNSHGNQAKAKFVTYKYSTHDIPPFKGSSFSKYKTKNHGSSSPKIEVTKSVEYRLPTVTEYIPTAAPAHTVGSKIEPGTTLFSTINTKGQLGGLSSDVPQNSVEYNDQPVPVIILRIYPQQLNDPHLFANLPKSHPYSSQLNNVNIQNLLFQYLKTLQRNNPYQYQTAQQSYHSPSKRPYVKEADTYVKHTRKQKPHVSQPLYYQQQTEAPIQQYYHQDQPQTYQYYSQYPTQTQYDQPQQYHYQQQVYDQNVYDKQQYYQQQQSQQLQNQQQNYNTEPQTNHQNSDETQYQIAADQVYYDPQKQYLTQEYVHQSQQYQQQIPESSYRGSGQLLTHENYPSDQHTKVIFRTEKGRTETPPQKEIKTIKIQVPENIANIEVQESERPFLPTPAPQGYQHQQDDQQQFVQYQAYPQEYVQQQYSSAEQQNQVANSGVESYQSQKMYTTRNAQPQPEIITNSDRGHVFNNFQDETQVRDTQPEQSPGYYYYQPSVQGNQEVTSDSIIKSESENYYTGEHESNPNQEQYYSASSTLKTPIVVADDGQQPSQVDQAGYSSTVSYTVAKRSRTKKRRVKIPSNSS